MLYRRSNRAHRTSVSRRVLREGFFATPCSSSMSHYRGVRRPGPPARPHRRLRCRDDTKQHKCVVVVASRRRSFVVVVVGEEEEREKNDDDGQASSSPEKGSRSVENDNRENMMDRDVENRLKTARIFSQTKCRTLKER